MVDLAEDGSDRLVDLVRAGELDVALIGAAGVLPAGLEGLTIISEGLVAAVPAGHPLDGRQTVSLARLACHPIVSLPLGTGVRTVFEQDCAAQGITPSIALQCSAPDAVVDLVSRGLGVAVLSATMAAGYADRLHAVPIDDVTTPALLGLVWRRAPHPATREFLRECRLSFGLASAATS